MTKKVHLKMAEIRKNDHEPCPFGLPIPFGCTNAGSHIEKMAPLNIMGEDSTDEEKEMIGKANTKMLAWSLLRNSDKPQHCKFAGHILNDNNAVECNFNDTAPGQGPGQAMTAAPFYSKVFEGSINGLNTVPVGFYSDYNVSRNLYMGTYSLQGAERVDLIKMAAEEVASMHKYTNNPE